MLIRSIGERSRVVLILQPRTDGDSKLVEPFPVPRIQRVSDVGQAKKDDAGGLPKFGGYTADSLANACDIAFYGGGTKNSWMDAETKNLLSGHCLGYLEAWVASLQGRILEDNGGRLKEVRLSSFTVDDLGKELVFAVQNDSRLERSDPATVLIGIMKKKGWYRLEDYKPSQR